MKVHIWLPYTPEEDKTIRIMKSGAIYRVTPQGPWIRINHPQNKHERRLANASR